MDVSVKVVLIACVQRASSGHTTGSPTTALTPTPPKKPLHRLTRKRALDELAMEEALAAAMDDGEKMSKKTPKKAKVDVVACDDENMTKACIMSHVIFLSWIKLST